MLLLNLLLQLPSQILILVCDKFVVINTSLILINEILVSLNFIRNFSLHLIQLFLFLNFQII
jgi:hypothetical protein